MLDLLRQRQRAQEVAENLGKRVELHANHIAAKAVAGLTRPVDRVLAFLDPLLGCTPSIVELRHPRSRSRQVGDDEADAGGNVTGSIRWRWRSGYGARETNSRTNL